MDMPEFVGGQIIDGHVVIRWPVNETPELSNSKKTRILASTGGFVPMIGNTKNKISLNVTCPV